MPQPLANDDGREYPHSCAFVNAWSARCARYHLPTSNTARQLKPVDRPSREVLHGGLVNETVYYGVSKGFAQRIATAEQVRFRVMGKKGHLEDCLDAKQLRTIEMVALLVP